MNKKALCTAHKRTSDLAVENFGFASPLSGTEVFQSESHGYPVLSSAVSKGTYRTVVCGKIWEADSSERRALVRASSSVLSSLTGKQNRWLIAGIGNPDVPSDALGSKICRRILVSRKASCEVFTVCPMTEARTGIDTAIFIRAIADAVHPDIIIAADALCAKSKERLQTVIQFSDCGITPGSALSHTNGAVSTETMPCPVVTVGVPTVISTSSMADDSGEALLVTRAQSDIITDCYASIIAAAVNSVIYGK